jgi:hypothetical protein
MQRNIVYGLYRNNRAVIASDSEEIKTKATGEASDERNRSALAL